MNSVTLLDGGMGQELVQRTKTTSRPLWGAAVMMDQPDIVEAVHMEYIDAGAEVITINAYSITPTRLGRHSMEDQFEALQQKSVAIARQARDKAERPARIAGCLPPLVGSYKAEVAMPFEQSLQDYRRIVEQQADGVDLFICETMASIEEAKAAVAAAMESGKPVWLSWTVNDDESATIRSGDPLDDALMALEGSGIDATLINCSKPEAISAAWPTLTTATGPIGAYANGFTSISDLIPGGTVDVLDARHDLGPVQYANFVDQWVENGASIVGGCCEVGPAHIRELAKRLGK